MLASARARNAAEILALGPRLRLRNAAAQTRIVSAARIRLDSRKFVRPFKQIICGDVSEFESHMPRQAVGSLPPTCERSSLVADRVALRFGGALNARRCI